MRTSVSWWSWLSLSLLPAALVIACGRGDAASLAGEAASAAVDRGRYLVAHVAACSDCHSPRREDDSFVEELWLSGIDCFVDVVPDDPRAGCLSTANLTDHETGLKNRTDEEIAAMFLRGVRPDGKALHPFMPYRMFGNMRAEDADAIVAYLRTVPGVDRTAAPSQPPFLSPERPAARVPESSVPMPRADYPQREAALRGRYLAGSVAGCMDCHTPRGPDGIQLERAFQGGMKIERELLGLSSGFPEVIYSSNLTPHETGIAGYSVADLVRAIKHGEDPDQGGQPLCPPMPAGPTGPFGGMTDADASDIAHYLLSLPPADNAIPVDCKVPAGARGPRAHR